MTTSADPKPCPTGTLEALLQKRISAYTVQRRETLARALEWMTTAIPSPVKMISVEAHARQFRLDERLRHAFVLALPLTIARDYQEETIQRQLQREQEPFYGTRGSLVCLGTGRGKTLTELLLVLRATQARVHRGEARFGRPTLVVVPSDLLDQWHGEVRKHFAQHDVTVHVAAATYSTRAVDAVLLDVDVNYIMYCVDVVLTSYESLRMAVRMGTPGTLVEGDASEMDEDDVDIGDTILRDESRGLFGIEWERVIADEASYMKNPKSLNATVVGMLKAKARVFMTATPTPNARVQELNALLHGLGCTLRIGTANEDDDREASEEEKRLIFQALIIADANLKNAPTMTTIPFRILSRTEEVNLEAEELAAYHRYKHSLDLPDDDMIREENAQVLKVAHVITGIQQLRRYCASPLSMYDEAERARLRADPTTPMPPKMKRILSFVQRDMKPDEKALVYCCWVEPLEDFAAFLRRTEISFLVLHGKIPKRDRAAILKRFCADDHEIKLLLMTDVGLRGRDGLQRANWIFQLGHDYTPGTDEQLEGRIKRLGQKRTTLHKIKLVLGGTYEMAVRRINATKVLRQMTMSRWMETDKT